MDRTLVMTMMFDDDKETTNPMGNTDGNEQESGRRSEDRRAATYPAEVSSSTDEYGSIRPDMLVRALLRYRKLT